MPDTYTFTQEQKDNFDYDGYVARIGVEECCVCWMGLTLRVPTGAAEPLPDTTDALPAAPAKPSEADFDAVEAGTPTDAQIKSVMCWWAYRKTVTRD